MAAKILGKLKGVIASACEPSRNGRKYTSRFWDAIFDSPLFKEGIKNRVMFGCMYHPEGEAYNQIHPGDESAICLTSVVKKGLEYIGTFDILPTRAGEVLKNLIDVGCVFGISSRGLNDYDTPIFDDPSTYELITFDIVAFPGIKSARLHPVTAVAESYGKRKVNKTKIMENLNKLANEDEQAKDFIDNALKAKEELHTYVCDNCGFETEMTDEEYDGSCPMCHEHHGEFGRVEESVKSKEDFDTDIQVEDLPDAFNEIEDKDLLQYANIVTINDEGVPYFDDGRHGRLEVITYPNPEFIKPGEKYLVNDIWYSEITNTYIVGAGDDWLLVG